MFKNINSKDGLLRLGLSLAIASVISNIFCCSFAGVPVSIPFAIFGAALIYASRDDNGAFSSRAIKGFIMCGLGFALGLGLYFITLSTMKAMRDPETASEFIKSLEELKDKIPGFSDVDLNDITKVY